MDKAIIGAGGFANEVKYSLGISNIKFFVDDEFSDESKNIYPLSKFNPHKYEVVVAIGDPVGRHQVVQRLPKSTKFFTHIHPSVIILDQNVLIGEGSIICAGTILTTNIKIGVHCHLNLQTSIGHDCVIGDYFTSAPGVRISGNCNIDDFVYIGTNSSVRQKINITKNTTIGLNAGVVKDIYESGTYVGVPAKKLNN